MSFSNSVRLIFILKKKRTLKQTICCVAFKKDPVLKSDFKINIGLCNDWAMDRCPLAVSLLHYIPNTLHYCNYVNNFKTAK